MMKKVLFMFITVLMMLFTISFNAFASSEPALEVYVTISDGSGKFVLVKERIVLEDIDNDEKFTINDALYIAHENNYNGGAKEGYNSSQTEYGLSLNKLWGNTSGAFGYCVNDNMAMSLADEINFGDHVKAYIYQDKTTYSDVYTYFDKTNISGNKGEEVTLVLYCIGYDENWNTITKPFADATITIDNKDTEYKTDANGKVTIVLNGKGTVNISAKSAASTLVPPICQAEIIANNNTAVIIACSVVALIVLSGLVGTLVIKAKNKNNEENL